MARPPSAKSDRPKSLSSSLPRYPEAPRRRELSVGVASTDKPLVFEVETAITLNADAAAILARIIRARLASSRSNGDLKYSRVSPPPRRSGKTG